VPDGPDLQHHDADRVRDDVVELAGDPHAFLGHGDARRHLALALGVAHAFLGLKGLHGVLALRQAAEPGERERRRHQQNLGERAGGVVEHDDCCAAGDDGEADAALALVAQRTDQERGDHPGGVHASRGHDEATVEEGQRRRQQPQRRRRQKRRAAAREQRQHDRHRRQGGDFRRGTRGVRIVAAQHHLDDGRNRGQHDHEIQAMPSREPLHDATVLLTAPPRLLPE
jgi:hypothetical protein